MAAVAERPDPVWPTERVAAAMVAEELESAEPPMVLDICNPREGKAKLNHTQERIAETPRSRRIAIHCAGGLAAWGAAKLPVVSDR